LSDLPKDFEGKSLRGFCCRQLHIHAPGGIFFYVMYICLRLITLIMYSLSLLSTFVVNLFHSFRLHILLYVVSGNCILLSFIQVSSF